MTFFTAIAQLATIVMLASSGEQAADPMIGAWGGQDQREGRDVEVVVIFTAAHQVAVWFDPTNGEVVHTNGGLWSRDGTRVTEIVEFNSDNPQRVGSSVSFDVELSDSELSIVGSPMRLARIDHGAGDGLQGAWELVEHSRSGTWMPVEEDGSMTVRLMTATRFQEVRYVPDSGELIGTIGGRYELDSGSTVETLEFSTSGDVSAGDSVRYSIEREAGAWRQTDDAGMGRAWRER